jgi:hypothetical protein
MSVTNDSTSHNGSAFETQQVYSASFCPVFNDTSAAGTLKVQGSNDAPVGANTQFTPTNWNDIPSATSTIASGAGPAIVVSTIPFQYIRVVYTANSGGSSGGTLQVNASFFSV